MREIKFRAKTREGEWVYGTPAFNDALSDIVEIRSAHEGTGTLALRDTLGQFVGAKDKNGKEIYEGDIVRYAIWGKVGCVGFHRNVWFLPYDHIERIPYEDKDYEVLGNIHDNPELLED